MDLQDAEHWELKAEDARDTAAKVSGENAKAIKLEIAECYAAMAREAQTVAAMRPLADVEAD